MPHSTNSSDKYYQRVTVAVGLQKVDAKVKQEITVMELHQNSKKAWLRPAFYRS